MRYHRPARQLRPDLHPSRNPIARSASSATSDSSAQAEAFARDNCELCGKNAVQLGGRDETHANPRRADFDISRTPPQGADLSGDRGGRKRLCVGLPPFDPQTGEIKRVPFARQSDLVLEQMRLCLEAAGSSLDRVLKCNVYCTPDESHFSIFNDIYSRYFPADAPARIFLHVPSWPGPFDIEIDCVAAI